ncbi:MAG: hypothetical protein K0B16_15435, partial [Burkholderiaceae bacterium]|nr:hypothetical protein [Burkholderiaceae bacterium]
MARFRVWTHRSPALVLGVAQRALRQRIEERANGGPAIVAREAGGGAVLAGPWMVSASIALPTGHPVPGENLAG